MDLFRSWFTTSAKSREDDVNLPENPETTYIQKQEEVLKQLEDEIMEENENSVNSQKYKSVLDFYLCKIYPKLKEDEDLLARTSGAACLGAFSVLQLYAGFQGRVRKETLPYRRFAFAIGLFETYRLYTGQRRWDKVETWEEFTALVKLDFVAIHNYWKNNKSKFIDSKED